MKHLRLLIAILALLVVANAPAAPKGFDLHQAVMDDNIQLVKRLLSKGAAIDVIGSRKYGYGSPLHLAVREGHLDIAKLLLKRGAQVDVLDPDDFTPLHNAAWNGNLEMTELLLGAGADIEASTYDGDTPLSLAQNNDQAQVAEFIQAKLQPAVTGDTKIESTAASDSGVRDVSGTYVMTNLTGTNWLVAVFVSKPNITIAQNGDQLTGTSDEGRYKLWGEIKGDTIKFDWATGIYTGQGRWTFKPGSNESSVILSAHSGAGEIKFNLTKFEPVPAQIVDISGTYIAETTYSGTNNYTRRIVKKMNGKLIVLKQTGNTITGSVGSQSNLIKGTREGNIINFYIANGDAIEGSWEINADATNLEGKWFRHGRSTSGKWNLTKIETKPPPSVTGTYIVETNGIGRGPATSTLSIVKKLNGKLIVLKQTGNTITGSVSSQSNWKIKGTREGNIINFWDFGGGDQINGSWEINVDATKLEGKWSTDGGSGASGKWNLTKIE